MHALRQVAVTMTPFQFEYVNARLTELSDAVGFPIDQLRFVVCLFLAYPLAMVYQSLPSPTMKHWLNIGIGILTAQFVFGTAWLHSFLSAVITYAIVKFAPTNYAPYIAFVFNMAFLAALHLHRMMVDYMGWSMDSTGSQMLLLIKLTSFAFNYYDGKTSIVIKQTDNPQVSKTKQTRQRLAITQLPSVLEYFGFVYSFTTFLAGPSFEFREYMDAVHGTKFVCRGLRQVPSNMTQAAATKGGIGVFFMALMAQFGAYANLPVILRLQEPVVKKWGRILLALFLTRGRYYCAWKLAEGATILTGTGFEGFDEVTGAPKGWNDVSNVDIFGFEFGQSIRDLSRAWNKGTQLWLERYVYSRTGNSLLATYLCSAIWHGFYPGYYLFFLSIPLATSVNRLSRRHIRPYFLKTDGAPASFKWMYDLIGMLCTSLIVNYLAVSFVVLSWQEAFFGFRAMHFVGHLCLLVMYLLLSAIPVQRIKTTKHL